MIIQIISDKELGIGAVLVGFGDRALFKTVEEFSKFWAKNYSEDIPKSRTYTDDDDWYILYKVEPYYSLLSSTKEDFWSNILEDVERQIGAPPPTIADGALSREELASVPSMVSSTRAGDRNGLNVETERLYIPSINNLQEIRGYERVSQEPPTPRRAAAASLSRSARSQHYGFRARPFNRNNSIKRNIR
jgi:hypothetical protein